MGGVLRLLGHHVHVGLHSDHWTILHAWSGRHTYYDVAGIVLEGFKTIASCPLEQEGLNLLKMSAGTRHLCEGVECFPDALRLEFGNLHSCFYFRVF